MNFPYIFLFFCVEDMGLVNKSPQAMRLGCYDIGIALYHFSDTKRIA